MTRPSSNWIVLAVLTDSATSTGAVRLRVEADRLSAPATAGSADEQHLINRLGRYAPLRPGAVNLIAGGVPTESAPP